MPRRAKSGIELRSWSSMRGLTTDYIRRVDEAREAQQVRTVCAFCSAEVVSSFAEGKAWIAEHRKKCRPPGAVGKRRSSRRGSSGASG